MDTHVRVRSETWRLREDSRAIVMQNLQSYALVELHEWQWTERAWWSGVADAWPVVNKWQTVRREGSEHNVPNMESMD